MITLSQLKERLESALPGSRVELRLFSGTDHFEAEIAAPQFQGKSLVEQHRMVYAAVSDLLDGDVHALALKTRPLVSN